MTYTIIFSAQAIKTFDAIKDQINERWGDKFVKDFEERTLRVLDIIQRSPFVFQSI